MGQHSFIPLHFLIVVLIHMMKLLRIYMKLWIQIEEKGFSHAVIFFFLQYSILFYCVVGKKMTLSKPKLLWGRINSIFIEKNSQNFNESRI